MIGVLAKGLRDYVAKGYLEAIGDGLYRVTSAAVLKFGLTRTAENTAAPPQDGEAANGSGAG